jgi:hypothetical protein
VVNLHLIRSIEPYELVPESAELRVLVTAQFGFNLTRDFVEIVNELAQLVYPLRGLYSSDRSLIFNI